MPEPSRVIRSPRWKPRELARQAARSALLCALFAFGCNRGAAGTGGVAEPANSSRARTDSGKSAPATAAPDAGQRDAGGERADADAGSPTLLHCGNGSCDLFDPNACAHGQGCVLGFAAQTENAPSAQCVAVGAGADGARCSDYADCQAGLDCTADADAGAEGACRRYCCELNSVRGCPAGQYCRVAIEGSRGAATGVYLCDTCEGCDLHDARSCGPGRACYLLGGPSLCTACLVAGATEPGASCTLNDDCAPGSGCFRFGGQAQCLAFCELGKDATCGATKSCRSATGVELPPGLGVCL